jgi:cyclohexanone monooxygenase
VKFWSECTPGYFNNEGGKLNGSPIFGESYYGPGFYAFDALLCKWRQEATLDGLEFSV